jgi:hypothetical protein
MGLAMSRRDSNTLMARDGAADAVVKGFKSKRMLNSRIWEPRSGGCSCILEPDFILKVADVICRLSDWLKKWAEVQDAIDRASGSVYVGYLTKAVLRHVIVRNGQRVVVQSEL